MSNEKELAYRYDLFITPDWRERFDALTDEHVKMPAEGRVLDVNCGTGAYAIEMAGRMKGKGEVVAVDPSPERLELARAKAQVKKVERVTFEQASAADLPFLDDQFDAVVGDASMLPTYEIEDVLSEMVRVAQPDGRVVLKMVTRGSFGEFFSVFWEALMIAGVVEQVEGELERIINEHPTVSDAELMAERAGLNNVESFISKEEFLFETGEEFIESPLIKDRFLDEWLEIVPESSRGEVTEQVVSIIERERHDGPFDVSIKATLISGIK
jgi:ubiquinone/menaquinone biosynthesis C-methylase UbiE